MASLHWLLSTEITRELRLEGYARELVRHIQELRKEAGFELSDRIVTYLHGGGEPDDVLEKFGGYVSSEPLRMVPKFGVILGVRSR